GHRGVGAVGALNVEGVGVGGAGGKLVVRRARGIGPGTVGADRHAAVVESGCGLGHGGRRAIDVADGQRAGGGNIGRQVGLGEIPRVGREHVFPDTTLFRSGHRGVGAVGALNVEGVGVGGAGGKLVVRRARGIGPGTV